MSKPVIWSYWGHEPMDHLRRMNGNDSIFSQGEWTEDWYERLHTDELIKKAHDIGINTIYTHFFKGFGLEYEKEEMENTRRLVENAHKYGIKVLGYCQLNSLYSETIPFELPEYKNMVARDSDGSMVTLGTGYYRYKCCFSSREFIEYIKKVIEYGIKDIGLDGFHFDNSLNYPCSCERCRQKFIDYLEDNVNDTKRTFGLKKLDYIGFPPYDYKLNQIHDPLYLWRIKFNEYLCASLHDELFSYVKSVSENKAFVLHNPGFPGNVAGFNPMQSSKSCDFIFAENISYIQREDGKLTSQVMGYKFAERFGYRVFNTSWLRDKEGCWRCPESYEEIMRYLAEGMIYGGLCGSPWTVRSTKIGNRTLLDDPMQYDGLKKGFKYFENHSTLYDGTTPLNHVKILYYPHNLRGLRKEGIECIRNTINTLAGAGIPFSIVTENDISEMGSDQMLIIPKIMFSRNDLYDKIIAAAKNGCKILIIGKYGVFNENGKERSLDDRVRMIHLITNVTQISEEQLLLQTVKDKMSDFLITVSDQLMIETKTNSKGELLIHILNPENERVIEHVEINIKKISQRTYKTAIIYSPENTRLSSFDADAGTIKLENLQTMATIVLD